VGDRSGQANRTVTGEAEGEGRRSYSLRPGRPDDFVPNTTSQSGLLTPKSR